MLQAVQAVPNSRWLQDEIWSLISVAVQKSPNPKPLAQQDSRPNFEREFFQDNSSSSGDDSQNNASDSSDNESEEEAKHF